MTLGVLVAGALALFGGALAIYGRRVADRFELDDRRVTPAVKLADGGDYIPTRAPLLLAQHFSAISAAGPIVGPITAAMWFGWAPAAAWILLGAVFIGATHDLSALVASVRHEARSVTDLMRYYASPRAYLLFLAFIWVSLVYVIIAFTDLTARQFVVADTGAGVASSSIMYLVLAVALGVALTKLRMPLGRATAIFVPALFVLVWAGQRLPLELPVAPEQASAVWALVILAYCFVASIVPLWALLQPRGYLGGYFLYVLLAVSVIGLLAGALGGGLEATYPAFRGWRNPAEMPLFPFLFVTIACGACSGFHGLVGSGTTSKQLACETDARLVGYGGMLLEGLVAVIALATVMILPAAAAAEKFDPNLVFARGIATVLSGFGGGPVLVELYVAFGMLAFATFVYDTLDVSTRLGRYILQELTGWTTPFARSLATVVTLAPAAISLGIVPLISGPEAAPSWQKIWPVFGSSNQLLAALTMLGVCAWLVRTRAALPAIAIPMVFMFVMTSWALWLQAWPMIGAWLDGTPVLDLNGVIAVSLLVIAGWIVVEVVRSRRHAGSEASVAPAAVRAVSAEKAAAVSR